MEYVLVTGAYGGMGRATVKALVSAGYYVFALDKKVEPQEEHVLPIQADVTDGASLQNALAQVKTVAQELTAIAHFAGIYALGSLVEMDEASLRRVFDINLFGVMAVNRIFLPLLKEGSRILITTSELAPLDPLPFTGLYAITKSALDKYAYSLRMEVQLLGISVAVLRPGAVDTGMLGVSTSALDEFCQKTELYSCNATRFKKVVDGVEARRVAPEKIAQKALKILRTKRPKYVYKINRNPLLLLLNALPPRWQTRIIGKILK